ncbi:hypothetical protein OnM2_022112 [Erysiphe neolycopersici]|uniref:Tf2-1-like SH3-like domain-containing protein n=1 Tax=Erysiphe neolycopersici TaxID=212602 RepID=A0A420I2E8_9PEZI|nr:hypothetical protein OnM2_022112 [Erysiphe neolycopersici]
MDQKLGTLIKAAQDEFAHQANKHRTCHPNYKVGDLVYVNACDIVSTRPHKGLDWKFLGPWKINKVIDNKAYQLEIPKDKLAEGLTPVFHPWKLHPASKISFPGQIHDPDPAISIFDYQETTPHDEYEVTEIVDFRETRRWGVQYKATYAGSWNEWNESPQWQPWTDFVRSKDLVLEYHRLHPKKPPPPENLINWTKPLKTSCKSKSTFAPRRGGSVRPPGLPDSNKVVTRRNPDRKARGKLIYGGTNS